MSELAVHLDEQALRLAVPEARTDEVEEHVRSGLHLTQSHEPARGIERDFDRARVTSTDEDRRADVRNRGVVRRGARRHVSRELRFELRGRPWREDDALARRGGRLGPWLRRDAQSGTCEQVRGVRDVGPLGVGDRLRVLEYHGRACLGPRACLDRGGERRAVLGLEGGLIRSALRRWWQCDPHDLHRRWGPYPIRGPYSCARERCGRDAYGRWRRRHRPALRRGHTVRDRE